MAMQVSALAALFLCALFQWALRNRKPRKALTNGKSHQNGKAHTNGKSEAADAGKAGLPALSHNMQRKAALAKGGPIDHAGSVVIVPDDNFDLNRTIFKTLTSAKTRYLAKAKLAHDLFWRDDAVEAIQEAYSKVPKTPSMDKCILDFMVEECDFSCEHADGSFLDHLYFCRDYSAVHYSGHSPKVLFLHSILGVGTNLFPMPKEKIPQLQSMLTDFEYRQVEAFPSILRLLNQYALIEELSANRDRLDKLQSISFHRVIDNEKLSMTAEDFWIQLNFQVIHMLDFLPAACWKSALSDPIFQVFRVLLAFMQETGKLEAGIDYQHPSGEVDVQGQPLTLGYFLFRFLPSKVTRKQFMKSVTTYSRSIGHSLDYTIQWAA